MRINSKSILAGMALGALLLTGCNDAEYDTLSNQAYILQTNTNANSSLKLTVGAEVATTTLNVRLSDVANVESRYRLVYDTAVVNEYNRLNETPYASLPQESFSLSSEETTIEAGASVSTPITLTVPPYSEALKASGKKRNMPSASAWRTPAATPRCFPRAARLSISSTRSSSSLSWCSTRATTSARTS